MKKILVLSLAVLSVSAFAQATGTQTVTNSSESTSTAATGPSTANVTTGPTTIGCLVNCAAPEGNRDLTDLAIAGINAGAATEVARINKEAIAQRIRNTPSVNGPPLVASNDTCMGSASVAANAPGIGIALGKTYTDTNCVMLKNSRELWNMGMKAAAMALMCTDAANREALELTGYECPQSAKKTSEKSAAVQYTDPVVRARLGLAPL